MLSFPYALGFLADLLRVSQVSQTLARFDEQSGSGDGRIWTAELSRPLWQVEISFAACKTSYARMIDARIRALRGSQYAFLWSDPSHRLLSNPGAGAVLTAISTARDGVTLSGLPPYYRLRAGDTFSVAWGGGRQYLAEVAETMVASSTGVLAGVGVMPFVPLGIGIGAAVELRRPVLKVFVPPSGHTPFAAMPGGTSSGGALKLMQRI